MGSFLYNVRIGLNHFGIVFGYFWDTLGSLSKIMDDVGIVVGYFKIIFTIVLCYVLDYLGTIF